MRIPATALAICLLSTGARADAVTNAYMVCAILDGTGMTSQECEVSGWDSSITTTINMTPGEARELCGKIGSVLAKKGITFGGRWNLNIKSPYSDDNSIAFCDLP